MSKDRLNILWTNGDPLTAELMVLMYAHKAKQKGLWETVRVIIWGTPAKLVAEDVHIQQLIREAQVDDVEFSACIACADRLGVTKELQGLQIETQSWGIPLTELIKNGEHLITI